MRLASVTPCWEGTREAYARHRAYLEACTSATDPELLELCRALMAKELRCREELARHSPQRLAELDSWERSPSFTERERAALEFVEQFLIDPSLISRDLVGRLETELGTSAVIDFANAIAAHEGSIRLAALLDLEPVDR